MKPIPFTLDAFYPDGTLRPGYYLAKDIEYIRYFEDYKRVAIIYADGSAGSYTISEAAAMRILFKSIRTSEEVAREARSKWIAAQWPYESYQDKWDDLTDEGQQERILCVQAGMDEIRGGGE